MEEHGEDYTPAHRLLQWILLRTKNKGELEHPPVFYAAEQTLKGKFGH